MDPSQLQRPQSLERAARVTVPGAAPQLEAMRAPGPQIPVSQSQGRALPGAPESKATVNPPSTQSSPETQRAKPQPPRWVGKRSSALIGIFQLREHSIPFSLVSSNYQMFSFSGRPETAKICGI